MAYILKISEAVAIALHSVALLTTRKGQLVSNRQIAKSLHISEAHLSKVLQRLSRTGIVKSVRGPKGGFFISKAAEEISLLEIYEIMEGPYEQVKCLYGIPVCTGHNCMLEEIFTLANSTIRDYFAQKTMADFIHNDK